MSLASCVLSFLMKFVLFCCLYYDNTLHYYNQWEHLLQGDYFTVEYNQHSNTGCLEFSIINVLAFQLSQFIKWRSQTGWDKIFYFVGANTFSQKFCPKQRESDATKDVQNSCNSGISFHDKKLLTVAWNSFLWQEVSFCDKKFLPITGHFYLWQEISSCERNFFLWKDIFSCDKKFLTIA